MLLHMFSFIKFANVEGFDVDQPTKTGSLKNVKCCMVFIVAWVIVVSSMLDFVVRGAVQC